MRFSAENARVAAVALSIIACGRVHVAEIGSGFDRELQLRCPKGEASCDRVARAKCDGEYYVLQEATLPHTEAGVLWKVACGVHQLRASADKGAAERRTVVRSKAVPPTAIAGTSAELPSPRRDRSQEELPRDLTPQPVPQPRPQPSGIGTCFAVSKDGYVLTAAHVAEAGAHIFVRFDGQQPAEASVVAESAANDWALLKASVTPPSFLTVASTRALYAGSPVFTFGFPKVFELGLEPKYTEGAISALSGLGGDASRMQIQVPIQPGSSGGPLVTPTGDVVGLVIGTYRAELFRQETGGEIPQSINWATKSDTFIASLPKSITAQRQAISAADAKRRARAATCLVVLLNE